MLSSSKSCNPPGALAAECHVWKSPTEGDSWYARLGLSAKDNSHGVMTYGCERSKSTKQLYFMLMQGQVFHSPFLLQTHPKQASSKALVRGSHSDLQPETTFVFPVTFICSRHSKGFLSSLQHQQRLTTTFWRTLPHLPDTGMFPYMCVLQV